jgi:hypothetical protein
MLASRSLTNQMADRAIFDHNSESVFGGETAVIVARRLTMLRALSSVLGVIVSLALSNAPFAFADDSEVIKEMQAGQVERIVKSFEEVEDFREVDDGVYAFNVEGIKMLIINKGNIMQLHAGFSKKISLSRMNEWNRTKRLSRAYSDRQGDANIDADFELTGGVTQKNIKEWMKTYVISLKAFKKHLDD